MVEYIKATRLYHFKRPMSTIFWYWS